MPTNAQRLAPTPAPTSRDFRSTRQSPLAASTPLLALERLILTPRIQIRLLALLLFNTTGTENTANGTAALELNETGTQNTASGAFALFNNDTGSFNTAIGFEALLSNTEGLSNSYRRSGTPEQHQLL
jgi:hypothetical protein